MAAIIDDRHEEYEDIEVSEDVEETEEIEELDDAEEVDNNDGLDLGGDQDEDVNTDSDEEDFEVDFEEGDELDETQEQEEYEEETDGEENDEVNEEETQVREKDAKIAELERQNEATQTKYAMFEQRVKETLEKLGISVDGDVAEALDRASAETEGKTLEEYRKERDEKDEIENAKQMLARQRFEQLAANDLAELKKSFPDLLNTDNIRKCFSTSDDFLKFGKLRDSGIDVKTAYMAVNGEKVRTAQAQAVQKKVVGDGKKHITSVAPKKASDNTVVMPKALLLEWRDNFPDLTDAEIRNLYRQTL